MHAAAWRALKLGKVKGAVTKATVWTLLHTEPGTGYAGKTEDR